MRARLLPLLVLLVAPVLAGCIADRNQAPATPAPSGDIDVRLLSPVAFATRQRDAFDVPSTLDAVPLHVDVYRPEGEGPFPTILVLSPYWSFAGDAKANEVPVWYIDYFVPRGYAVALGEMRGTRDSGGCWDFGGPLDQQDGHDIVEALAAQPWSNGKVGMLGQSHVGMSQVAAAITAPPHLTTIVPIAAVTDWYRYLHKAGAPYVVNRGTPPAYFAVHASPANPPSGGEGATPDWVLTQAQTACVDNLVHLSQSAELDGDKDAYWQERDLIAGAGNIKASVFLVHGFLDENVKTDHFLDLWLGLPADTPKKAWFGQWSHSHPGSADGQFLEWRTQLHAWYDHWLLGIDNGILGQPTVTVQDNTGAGRWETSWPPARITQDWLLADGALAPAVAGTDLGQARYLAMPGDDRATRSDLAQLPPRVAFTSAALQEPLHIAGEATLTLQGVLDGPTGRWIAVLYDEAPDGSLDEVSRAYLDARHRLGLAQGTDVPAGDQQYEMRFFPRDHVLAVGHRLVLQFLGGDLGCSSPQSDGTCEGTGIVPVERPVIHGVVTGPGAATRLHLPVPMTRGPPAPLTPMDGWLDQLPP